jgi:3-isopropylmalate/(R)-2-methylmalate dehydratase small subunit
VLAKSAARIFFRNAINVGLPVLICDTDLINDGDRLEIDLPGGIVRDVTTGATLTFARMPALMRNILNEGGLVPYIKKYGDLKVVSG